MMDRVDNSNQDASPYLPTRSPTVGANSQTEAPLSGSLSFRSSSGIDLPSPSSIDYQSQFSHFNSLPPELRLRIWELVAKNARQTIHVIENCGYKFHTSYIGKFWIDPKSRVKTDAKVPALFQVNYESREVAKKYWTLQFFGMNAISPFYFNFERDTLFAHSLAVLNTLFGLGLREDLSDYQHLSDPSTVQRTMDYRNKVSNEEERKMREKIKNLSISGQGVGNSYAKYGGKFTNLEHLKVMGHQSNNNLLEAETLASIYQQRVRKGDAVWKVPTIGLITREEQMEIDLLFVEKFDKGQSYLTLASGDFPNLDDSFEVYPTWDTCSEPGYMIHRMKKGNKLSVELARRKGAAATNFDKVVDEKRR